MAPGPRPTWMLQLGRATVIPTLSARARPRRGRSRPEHRASRPLARSPCEDSPAKARAGLELPAAATALFRTLSPVFLSERPIEFWGLWFGSPRSAPWKARGRGKNVAQNQPIPSLRS